jgi:hypothetical protein
VRTFIAHIEIQPSERLRIARRSLARRRAWLEDAQKVVAAHLPNHDLLLVERNGHQPPSVGREAHRRHGTLVTLEHVEARRCLNVVDDGRPLVCSDS